MKEDGKKSMRLIVDKSLRILSTRLGSPWIDNDVPYARGSLPIRTKDRSCHDGFSRVCFDLLERGVSKCNL